jgi:hypothetical protein
MKRLIVAVAIALSTAPALADVGAPFDQNELDRALPALSENVTTYEPVSSERMPFEQSQLDRGSLGIPEQEQERVLVAQMGGTSYKSSDEESESAWSTDHNFIAPAQ